MQSYPKEEIERFSKYEKKHIECDVLPLSEIVKLLENGWVIYDTQITADANIKILTMAKIT